MYPVLEGIGGLIGLVLAVATIYAAVDRSSDSPARHRPRMMMPIRAPRLLAFAIACLTFDVGCNITLPARREPTRAKPALPPPRSPPVGGNGRIYIDVVDGPARVERLAGSVPELVCLSPCWVDLPIGHHELRFVLQNDVRRSDVDVVKVFDQPVVYRRALGFVDLNAVDKTLGLLAFATGGSTLLTFGAIAIASDEDSDVFGGFAIAGGVLTALGVYFLYRGRTVVQQGAWTTWPVSEAP